jgi:hypothetical protein
MKSYLPFLLGTWSTIGSACAFVPGSTTTGAGFCGSRCDNQISIPSSLVRNDYEKHNEAQLSFTALYSDNKKKGGLDGNMRNKLVTESIAPWRTLRLFLYFSFGSGAFIGGLVNGSGAIAASASPEFNLQTEVRWQKGRHEE